MLVDLVERERMVTIDTKTKWSLDIVLPMDYYLYQILSFYKGSQYLVIMDDGMVTPLFIFTTIAY